MSDSHFADNLIAFCRGLRAAGMPLGSPDIAAAQVAVRNTGVQRRDDLRAALRAVLVRRVQHVATFERAFEHFFCGPADGTVVAGEMHPFAVLPADTGDGHLPVHDVLSASRRDSTRQRDFDDMNPDEMRAALALLGEDLALVPPIETRRHAPAARGTRFELRRALRGMLRADGELLELPRRAPRPGAAPLVLLADISGSMSRYAAAFLQFAHLLSARRPRLHTFVFGTRLSNISGCLAHRDADTAIARAAAAVADWDGGTRIADCLAEFNRRWRDRVLTRRATVVLLSDGLERGSPADAGRELQCLRRNCRTLLWLNPLLRWPDFEPLAAGIRAMLPHVDEFLPGHNVDSLLGLTRILAGERGRATR